MCFPYIIPLKVVNMRHAKALKTLSTSNMGKLHKWLTYDFQDLGLLYGKLMSIVGEEDVSLKL